MKENNFIDLNQAYVYNVSRLRVWVILVYFSGHLFKDIPKAKNRNVKYINLVESEKYDHFYFVLVVQKNIRAFKFAF